MPDARALSLDLGPGDERLFIDESLEQIEAIETGLLDLERGERSPQVVNEIFRGAHTLKGSAATIGHRRMAELTHALEDVFGALRAGTLPELGRFADVSLSTIDVLRTLVDEVSAGRMLTDAPDGLTVRLRTMLVEAAGSAGKPSDQDQADIGEPGATDGRSRLRLGRGDRAAAPRGARPGRAMLRRALRGRPSQSVAGRSVAPGGGRGS